MDIEERVPQKGIAHLLLKGDLDLYNAPELRQRLVVYVERGDAVILDLKDMGYIDSSGIGVLVSTYTQMKNKKRPLWFIHVGGPVRKVLKLTSLLGFFPIAEDLKEALGMIEGNKTK